MQKRFPELLAYLALVGTTASGAVRNPEPRITSVAPFMVSSGTTAHVLIHGTHLEHARAIVISGQGVTAASIRYSQVDTSGQQEGFVEAVLNIAGSTPAGVRQLRVVTADGVSNAMSVHVTADRTQDESVSSELTGPALINGKLSKPGEVDTYWIHVAAGETWTFEATAGTPAFDPAVAIYERSGSWFDPARLNRIAYNDEPLHFPNLSHDARLVHRFEKAGQYAVSLSGFSGQGGPDCVYALRVRRGVAPPPDLHPLAKDGWEERLFTRTFTPDWLQQLRSRGTQGAPEMKQAESWAAVPAGSREIPVVTVPALVHGSIAKPADVQAVELRIDKPEDLVLEVETPRATMPRFNPVVRLLDAGGNEMVTNVYTKLNNNGLYMMKMIQAKSTVSLRSPGSYRLEFRDITTDRAGDDFEYRVLIRPQIPHIGKVSLTEEQLNLRPGGSTELHISLEREEQFSGTVAFEVEGLPAGVSAVSGLADPVERPALPNGGRLERYTPKTQTSVLVFTATPEARETAEPVSVRLVVRPILDGRPGKAIPVREIPVFVTPKSAS